MRQRILVALPLYRKRLSDVSDSQVEEVIIVVKYRYSGHTVHSIIVFKGKDGLVFLQEIYSLLNSCPSHWHGVLVDNNKLYANGGSGYWIDDLIEMQIQKYKNIYVSHTYHDDTDPEHKGRKEFQHEKVIQSKKAVQSPFLDMLSKI